MNRSFIIVVVVIFSDCDKRAEQARHDHRPVAQLSRNLDGHDPDERGAGHLLPLVGVRHLQQHEERQRRRSQAPGKGEFSVPSGQSYKHFMLVNYDSRVIVTRELAILRL